MNRANLCFLCVLTCSTALSFDIRVSNDKDTNSSPELEDVFADAVMWMKRPMRIRGEVTKEFRVIITNTWGGFAGYTVIVTNVQMKGEKDEFEAYVCYTGMPSGKLPEKAGVLLQIGPLSSKLVRNIFSEGGALLKVHLEKNAERSVEKWNVRKESACLISLIQPQSSESIGINFSGSEANWKAVDGLCESVLKLIRDTAPHTPIPERLINPK